MADYSTIKGFTIQSLSSDPYASVIASATWASGGNLNTGRGALGAAKTGTQTTGMVFGGTGGPLDASFVDVTEKYDGTSWTEVNDLNTARRTGAGVGTQTAAQWACGIGPGSPDASVLNEIYDGTSWSEEAACPQKGQGGAGVGITTASLKAGGADAPGTTGNVQTWNGTAWTEVNNLTTATAYAVGAGTTTAGLCIGGQNPSPPYGSDKNESYDGTSWSEQNDLNTGRNKQAGWGIQTAAIIAGGDGDPPVYALTESYDGTSWTEVGDLATARKGLAGGGASSSSGYVAGGEPGYLQATEEWSPASPLSIAQEGQVWYNSSSQVLKGYGMQGTGAWAAGGDMNVGRSTGAGAGASQDAALAIGGTPDGISTVNVVESYDGTTWTEVADMLIPRRYLVGVGIQTAALACGGSPSSSNVERWDGSSWTEIANLTRSTSPSNTTSYATGFGSSTSAIFAGGSEGGAQLDLCEQWNGTSWAEVADLNATRSYGMGAGTSGSAGLFTGGRVAGPTISATNEQWNGTSWTEVNNINTARNSGGASNQGTVTASLIFGGNTPPGSVVTEQWDGTSWTEVGDLSTPVYYQYGAGVSGSALSVGGDDYPGANRKTTFEWTIPDAIKTFTAS